MNDTATPQADTVATWQELLAERPPHGRYRIKEFSQDTNGRARFPEVTLYCSTCEQAMRFEPRSTFYLTTDTGLLPLKVVQFACKQCETQVHGFALLVEEKRYEHGTNWYVTKVGQMPAYGPNTPARLVTLLGPQRDQYLKGRRAEAQGFGIGAFGYYRRVVEALRNRLLVRVIEVAESMNVSNERIEPLRSAIKETRFGDAMKLAKTALPDALLIKGRNPFEVLHTVFSDGLHEGSDSLTEQQCLARAEAGRIVLTELAERLSELARDQSNLEEALKKLDGPREAAK